MSGSQAGCGHAQEPALPGDCRRTGRRVRSKGSWAGQTRHQRPRALPACTEGLTAHSPAPATAPGPHTPQPTFGPSCPLLPAGAAKKAQGRAVAPLGRGRGRVVGGMCDLALSSGNLACLAWTAPSLQQPKTWVS